MNNSNYKLPLFVSLAIITPFANASEQGFWIAGETNTYSSITPISQLLNELQGHPVVSGTYAYSHSQIELGERRDNLSILEPLQ